MSDALPPTDNPSSHMMEQSTPDISSRPLRLMRRLGIIMVILAGLLAWYLLVFFFGWQNGQSILEEKREAELSQQLERQITLARENISEGSFTLAQRRLEWILDRTPENAEAKTLYQDTQAELALLLTPQIIADPAATATPIPVPSPTPTSAPIEDPAAELQRIRQLITTETWDEAVPSLVSFKWQFPSYERQEIAELLYDAYIGLGLELLVGEQVELGLSYLEQAEKLGDLTEPVTDYRTWAELYLQGIAFYDVNWGAATYYLRDLCLAAPFYQSSCDRLYEALIAYGDQYAFVLDWCPAQLLYEEAIQHDRTQQLIQKLGQARESCLLATPTPTAPITDNLPITGTLPFTNTFYTLPLPTVLPYMP